MDEKKLLYLLQKEFPLVSKPFAKIAGNLGIAEEELLSLLRNWQKSGKLRQISAIFNPTALYHRSSLLAFKVPEEKLQKAIDIINSHLGVSHNYLRNHSYNLWFTLVVPPGQDLLEEAQILFKRSQADDFLYLPILKSFKISVIFEVDGENFSEENLKDKEDFKLTELDIRLVKLLQEPLPLVSEPFKVLAQEIGLEEKEIFLWLRKMKERGALRRLAALFKHTKMGFRKNIMVAWRVPEERIEEIGKALSRYNFITHCYLRKSYPHWNYNLYTMCHFKEEGKEKIQELSKEIGIYQFLPLETVKELKKVRLKLFYN